MSINLLYSNHLDQLLERVELPPIGLFNAHHIIFQNSGVKDALTLALTEKYGTVANLNFEGVNSLVKTVASWLLFEKEVIDREEWVWGIFRVLDDKGFQKRYPKIATYYENNLLKKVQLAEKMADLFDQYSGYREEMVAGWRNHDLFYEDLNLVEEWQKDIYLAALSLLGDRCTNRAEFTNEIILQLDRKHPEDMKLIAERLPVVYSIGVDVLTPINYRFLCALGEATEVNLLMFNPCTDSYWYDCQSAREIARRKWPETRKQQESELTQGNELLLFLGKLGRDMFSHMFDAFPTILNHTSGVTFQQESTLLGKLQTDILQNRIAEERVELHSNDLTDGSFLVTGNYTEAREVEVLLDYILGLLNEDNDLQPHDILVMAPEIERYEPYIHAVFGNSPVEMVLPYTISDVPLNIGDDIVRAILDLLVLRKEEINAELVMHLLENPVLKKRYGVQDLELVRRALRQTVFVFGEKGKITNDTHLIAWEQSKKQLLYGVVMDEGELSLSGFEVSPYPGAEGNATDTLLALVDFVDDLFRVARENEKERTLSEWTDLLLGRLNFWVNDNEELELKSNHVRENVVAIVPESADVSTPFDADTYAYLVNNRLSVEFKRTQRQGSRVLFCNMQSMKGLSYKVIAVLGLNDVSYPRKSLQAGFDLMALRPQKTDRNLKDNDKYLFLEALMSCKDQFYCSYISRRAKDNKPLNPSIVIQELLDYLEDQLDVQDFIVHHPKDNNSEEYYLAQSKLQTFKPSSGTAKHFDPELVDEEYEETQNFINWLEVESYFRHPQRWYCRNVLGISFYESDLSLPESESFGDIDNLQKYFLKSGLFEEKTEVDLKRELLLPLGNLGTRTLEAVIDEISGVQNRYMEHSTGVEEVPYSLELELSQGETLFLDNATVLRTEQGKLKLVSYCVSSSTGKYLFPLLMRFMWFRANGIEVDAVLEIPEKKGVTSHVKLASQYSENDAKRMIEFMVSVYKQRQKGFIAFDPKLSFELIDVQDERFLDKAKKYFGGEGFADLFQKYAFQDDKLGHVWNKENMRFYIENLWV